jgi:hypothetical protein
MRAPDSPRFSQRESRIIGIVGMGIGDFGLLSVGFGFIRVQGWALAVVALNTLLAVHPGRRMWQIYRHSHRQMAGLCPECGYDLRASKERCLECGREIEEREVPFANQHATIADHEEPGHE